MVWNEGNGIASFQMYNSIVRTTLDNFVAFWRLTVALVTDGTLSRRLSIEISKGRRYSGGAVGAMGIGEGGVWAIVLIFVVL